MTVKNDWDLSKYDDLEGATELRLQQLQFTPNYNTDSFYDLEDNIRAHKSDCDEDSIISDTSSTSSGVQRRVFRFRT